MEPIEARVRASLQSRAEDVEPTPHLYRGVQDRIGRRRRVRVAAWSLAGVAAVAAAVLVVPTILGNLDQRTPEVTDTPDAVETPEGAPGAGEPTHALLASEAGVIELVDLADGSRDPVSSSEGTGARVTELVAAPGGTAERFRAAAVLDRGDGPATIAVMDRTGNEGVGSVTDTTEIPGGSGMPPAIAISSDGGWLAYTGISQTVDAAVAVYVVPIDAEDATLDLAAAVEIDTVTAPDAPDTVRGLVEWTGPAGAEGDLSGLTLRTPDGFETVHLERTSDGFEEFDRDSPVDSRSWLDLSSDFATGDVDTSAPHLLTVRDDGELELTYDPWRDGQGTVSVVSDRFDAADDVRLDARGRTALLVGGGAAVAVRYLEEGTERGPAPGPEVVELADGVAAGALLGGVAAAGGADDHAGEDGVEEAPETPSTGSLGDGLVVASDTTVSLVRPDGSQQELVTFPQEGESTVVAVAVRPGSTADDLTVAITTRGEGTFDVRWLRAIDGQAPDVNVGFPAPPIGSASPDGVGGFPVTAPDLQDGGGTNVAWSPDGDLLAAFVRPAPGEPAEVRTIGWTDDGPSDDPDLAATFELDTGRPLTLRGWSWTDGTEGDAEREGELHLVDRMAHDAFTVRLDRQADGAPGMPASNPLVAVAGEDVLDVADADGDGTVETVLRRTGGPNPVLEVRSSEAGEERVTGVEVDAVGPRDVSFVATSPRVTLVVLDPAQPVLVDPETGDVRPAPLDGEVASADLIR